MPVVHRGEVELTIDNETYRLKLTLGAMAEIEQMMGLTSMADFQTLFVKPKTSTVVAVVSAMLAAGEAMPIAEAKALIDDIALAELDRLIGGLNAAFEAGLPQETSENPQMAAGT